MVQAALIDEVGYLAADSTSKGSQRPNTRIGSLASLDKGDGAFRDARLIRDLAHRLTALPAQLAQFLSVHVVTSFICFCPKILGKNDNRLIILGSQ